MSEPDWTLEWEDARRLLRNIRFTGRPRRNLERLYDWLCAEQIGAWQIAHSEYGQQRPGATERMLTYWLTNLADSLRREGRMGQAEALEWLTVAAGAPSDAARERLEDMAHDHTGGRVWDFWRRPLALWREETVLDRWRRTLPRRVAPLAWAAGLTPAEAGTRYATITPERIRELRLLAGLRGYRLPDGWTER